jgi:DNA-directed RNA polymerase specialized sigma24 family protein
MSNSAEVATAGEGKSPSSSLSEAQLSAFWAGIISNFDAARRMAAQFVSRQNVDDVVHSAAVFFVESLRKKPVRFPKTDKDFRYQFLAIVHNHAINCVSETNGPEHPIQSHWAKEPEPVVSGRRVADRELGQVFTRNNSGKYDAPAPAAPPAKDDVDQLDQILRRHLADLPRMQRQVIHQTFFEGRKRAEVARRLRISVHTYDNHLQAAFRSLRLLLTQEADVCNEADRSHWYDLIEELHERREVARLRRGSGKTGKRSTSQGERSTPEREGSLSDREDGKTSGADAA